ncbi:transcriptional regulator, MarR family [Desulfocurvibacter africanus PCS]|uniref:Transcriptional regulator, MarR family n=1 Tax=Desulfocurvibacter africanus PCS TaxID=1262666 RepID=M5PSB8_DESAF|nr:MarR family transcriptional regulator [Desulfocurvibacter africanus]EMG37004.1 transcriptional regulator, MarR family [Desulfocurvibacter africanus PCS]
MLYTPEIPSEEILQKLSKRYPQMDPDSFRACLVLARCGTDMNAAFEDFLVECKLSQGRFMVLGFMNRTPEEPFTPTQLARALGVSRATMTGLVDGLESAGLVERGIHSEDRRKMRVRMTAKGRKAMDEIMPEFYGSVASIMSGVNSSDHKLLVEMLETVSKALVAYRRGENS